MDISNLPPIKRVVDWEWIVSTVKDLGPKTLVMRCYETEDGRLYRADTGELWVPNGEYRFRGEVPRVQGAVGR